MEIGSKNLSELELALNSTDFNFCISWSSPNQDTRLQIIAGHGIKEFTIDQTNFDCVFRFMCTRFPKTCVYILSDFTELCKKIR